MGGGDGCIGFLQVVEVGGGEGGWMDSVHFRSRGRPSRGREGEERGRRWWWMRSSAGG